MTMNYEMKRFLMDCGMDWRETYLDYLPEEIIQYIYKMVFTDAVNKTVNEFTPRHLYMERKWEWFGKINNWLKPLPEKHRETIDTLYVTIPMTELFPHGFANGYSKKDFNKRNTKQQFGVVEPLYAFTDDEYSEDQDDKTRQIMDYKSVVINGRKFESFNNWTPYEDKMGKYVAWRGGTIPAGDLCYTFWWGNIALLEMNNHHKITKHNTEVTFKLTISKDWDRECYDLGVIAEHRSAFKQFMYSLEGGKVAETILATKHYSRITEAY